MNAAAAAPFRWGLLGAGDVARNFGASVALLPGHSVAAVASRSAARAAATAARLGGARAVTDYAALVADGGIDAVYVATPAALHRDHVGLALEAGKPVLCEKPFTVTAEDARALADLARTTGTFLMEAMWTRFIPAIEALRARIEAGEIGELRMFEAELGFAVPYDPANRFFDPALGGGALLDLGIYPLSLAWHLLGPPEAGQLLTGDAPNGVDARAAITLRHAGGALSSLSCSFDQRLRNTAVVTGTRGSLALDAPLYAPERITRTRAAVPAPVAVAGGDGTPGRLARLTGHPQAVRLRRRYAPLLRQLLRRERTTQAYPFAGHGYQFEAAEVARCVRAGLGESPVMPLGETVAILDCLETLRETGRYQAGPSATTRPSAGGAAAG